MKNNNIVLEPGELDELEEVEFRRTREHAEKYLRAHGYEIISHEMVHIPHMEGTGLFVKLVVSKDGEKRVHCQQVR